jgi:RHS repeat-associated protein
MALPQFDVTTTSTTITDRYKQWQVGRRYELANHLGNVLATIKDEKLQIEANTPGTIDYYEPSIVTATDNYPFGMPMPNRTYSLSSGSKYRFGFNGQEKDDEVYGPGNLNTAEFWEYDTRIGRRWNADPVVKEQLSPYNCFSGNPIVNADPNGDDDFIATTNTTITEYCGADGETKTTTSTCTSFEIIETDQPNNYIERNTCTYIESNGNSHSITNERSINFPSRWLSERWDNFYNSNLNYFNKSYAYTTGGSLPIGLSNRNSAYWHKNEGDGKRAVDNFMYGALSLIFQELAAEYFFGAKALKLSDDAAETAGAELLALPQGRVPNSGGNIVTFGTSEPSTFYRVYSGNPNGGAFLTKIAPKNSAFAREGLALPPENAATFIQKVSVPGGVTLQRSRAIGAFGKRGGLEQFEILNYDSRIIFHPGTPLK